MAPQLNKNRMDFQLVKKRLQECKYSSLARFLDDVKHIFAHFRNCVGDNQHFAPGLKMV